MIKDFPTGKYAVIYADPPWSFKSWTEKGKNRSPDFISQGMVERHYATMTMEDIKNLPVENIAADDCALFMWVVDCQLPEALDVGAAWGFEFKTVALTWVKETLGGGWHVGMGYWTRGNPEQCLLFTRGAPKRRSANVRQLLVAARSEHSRKPVEAYDRIEALLDGPYIELFSRRSRPGWVSWGNQLDGCHLVPDELHFRSDLFRSVTSV